MPGLGLDRKVAAASGGGPGIAWGGVLALATEGATVVTIDSDEGAAGEVVRDAGDLAGRVVVVRGDASDTAVLERAAAEADRLGGLEIVVNVVGAAAGDPPMRPAPA